MTEVDLLRAALALLFVLGLIAVMTWLARKMRLPGFASGGPGRRLEVIETVVIDPRHKAVLLRSDGAEHLLVLGPGAPLCLHRRGVAEPLPAESAP